MIVGAGMIAHSFSQLDKEDVIFFCSGVSNSSELEQNNFLREIELIQSLSPTHKKFIYFSSYFVNFEQYLMKDYYKHKLNVEQIIKNLFTNFTIYRLPQVVGQSKNPKTLTNFIASKISKNELISIYKGTQRNLIDISDVVEVVNYANNNNLFKNQIINLVAPKNYGIVDIVKTLEHIMQRKIQAEYLEATEDNFPILLSDEMGTIYEKLKLNFDETYLRTMIKKYYGEAN